MYQKSFIHIFLIYKPLGFKLWIKKSSFVIKSRILHLAVLKKNYVEQFMVNQESNSFQSIFKKNYLYLKKISRRFAKKQKNIPHRCFNVFRNKFCLVAFNITS